MVGHENFFQLLNVNKSINRYGMVLLDKEPILEDVKKK
jgi:hypothetical protein